MDSGWIRTAGNDSPGDSCPSPLRSRRRALRASPDELRYEVSVPFDQDITKLAKIIKRLDGRDASVVTHSERDRVVEALRQQALSKRCGARVGDRIHR
jgi:hypothetical protein